MSNYLKLFFVLSVVHLVSFFVGQEQITWYTKPLLLPCLFYETKISSNFTTKKWLLSALFFSWVGDVILLFADKGELYFIFGLISFLIAHILFILLFIKQKKENPNSNLIWLGFVLVAAYLYGMLKLLFPSLGDLKIPVTIYAFTISTMLIMAIKGYFHWRKPNNLIILLGAIFFVSSDSILAINKFHSALPNSGFWIMTTYLLAQYLITTGILKLNADSK